MLLTPVAAMGGVVIDPDILAYAAAVVTNGGAALTTPTLVALSNFAIGLKADGVWTLLDRLVWCGNENSVAGRTDIANPAKLWSVNGTLPFTALAGFTGDGSTGYLSAIDNLSTATHYTQNIAAHFVFINQANGTGQITQSGLVSGNSSRILSSTAANGIGARTNTSNDTPGSGTPISRPGFVCGARLNDAANEVVFFNPATTTPTATGAFASSAVATSPYALLRGNTVFSPDRVLMGGYGGLNATQVLALYNRSLTLASALGCPLS